MHGVAGATDTNSPVHEPKLIFRATNTNHGLFGTTVFVGFVLWILFHRMKKLKNQQNKSQIIYIFLAAYFLISPFSNAIISPFSAVYNSSFSRWPESICIVINMQASLTF